MLAFNMFEDYDISTSLDKTNWGDYEILKDIKEKKFKITLAKNVKGKKKNTDYLEEIQDKNQEELTSENMKNEWTVQTKKKKNTEKYTVEETFTIGTITRQWNSEKGYGFVSIDETSQKLKNHEKKSAEKGVFIHISNILCEEDKNKIQKGSKIQYKLIYNEQLKKPQAFQAKVV
tara:strand:- start:2305 stop:2829 length:525 start_codon:yes stop_codon:yes gene_type:complete